MCWWLQIRQAGRGRQKTGAGLTDPAADWRRCQTLQGRVEMFAVLEIKRPVWCGRGWCLAAALQRLHTWAQSPHKEPFHSSESQEQKATAVKKTKITKQIQVLLLADLDVVFAQRWSAVFLRNQHVMFFFSSFFWNQVKVLLVQCYTWRGLLRIGCRIWYSTSHFLHACTGIWLP